MLVASSLDAAPVLIASHPLRVALAIIFLAAILLFVALATGSMLTSRVRWVIRQETVYQPAVPARPPAVPPPRPLRAPTDPSRHPAEPPRSYAPPTGPRGPSMTSGPYAGSPSRGSRPLQPPPSRPVPRSVPTRPPVPPDHHGSW
jgi:hypothetical protein